MTVCGRGERNSTDPETERWEVAGLAGVLFWIGVALVVAAALSAWALGAPLPGGRGADGAAAALVTADLGAALVFGDGAAGRRGRLLAGLLVLCAGGLCLFAATVGLAYGSMDLVTAYLEEVAR